jgi:hypothetical protein
MLTKEDLSAIKDLIQSETRIIVQQETRAIIQQETRAIVQQETRAIIQQETRAIIQEELQPVKKDIKKIDRRLKRLTKTVDIMGRRFDEEDVNLHKRITKIEDHLGLAN